MGCSLAIFLVLLTWGNTLIILRNEKRFEDFSIRSHLGAITVKEVCDLADDWFHGVASGESAGSSGRLFCHSDARIYAPNGQTFTLEDHRLLHTKWPAERHLLGDFHLTLISDAPPRVSAIGTVYWEGRYIEPPSAESSLIKAVAGKDWIIERLPNGKLIFILYCTRFFHLLPESAPVLL